MKNRIKRLLLACLLLTISFSAYAQISKNITIENYTDRPLTFIEPVKSINSTILLPNSVPRGYGKGFSKATGLIQIQSPLNNTTGVFLIGYSSHEFCEYTYSMDVKDQSTWFMYASRVVNMSETSCSVDVDEHEMIVFQKMNNP